MTPEQQAEIRRREQAPKTDDCANHVLKTWPQFFDLVADGRKPFECRINDRVYSECDVLQLNEYHPETGYTGRFVLKQVTYVLFGGAWGIDADYVVMGLSELFCEIEERIEERQDALTTFQNTLTAAQEDAGRLREALGGAVEAMRPMAAETPALQRCTFCGAFLSTKGHAADCPFRIAHEALTAGED